MPPTTTAAAGQSIVIGNFANEMMALYSNEGNGLFIDEAPRSTIGQASLLSLTFAAFFFDADLDGRLDIFAANGHVADDIGDRSAKGDLRAAAASVPQPRIEEVRSIEPGRRCGIQPAGRRPRRRVRRLRSRRRSRHRDDQPTTGRHGC